MNKKETVALMKGLLSSSLNGEGSEINEAFNKLFRLVALEAKEDNNTERFRADILDIATAKVNVLARRS